VSSTIRSSDFTSIFVVIPDPATPSLTLHRFDSFLDQLFSAAQGRGAFLNESQRLPLVSPPPAIPSISSALLGVGQSSFVSLLSFPSFPTDGRTLYRMGIGPFRGCDGKEAQELQ
jgi:hypothetical protein